MKYCQIKKYIVLMLVVAFVFTLSACTNKNTVSDADTSTSISSKIFVKPESYTSVLFVSINPQFKLYLDESNNVLAIEPVNDDAKSLLKNIDLENKTVEAVVGNIVEKANEKGFIKENVTVDFEITEQKDGIDNSYILTKVVSAVNQKATELKIEIKTEIKESDKSQITETNSENTQTAENSKPTTSSKTEESTSKPSTTSKPGGSKPTHTHIFSAATCTQPKTCSCGATEGKALGHNWIDATCKVAKTCSVCKITEGNKVAHKYVKGVCSVCEQKDPEFKSFRGGTYEMKFESDFYEDTLIISTLQVAKESEKIDGFSDMIASFRGYISFDRVYDDGWFFTLPEYEIWEGNGKRQPTREEALNIAKGKNMILYYNSKPYYAEACSGSGDPFEDIVFSENSLTLDSYYYNNAIIKFEYDGYDTLKFTSVPEGTLDKYYIKTGSVMTRKK